MTALERRVNMAAVLLPFVVVAIAVPLLWGDLFGWSDVERGLGDPQAAQKHAAEGADVEDVVAVARAQQTRRLARHRR